ncbi:hypothetical protein C7474_2230 [Microbacterium telephonicum]|uniref:Uncharacterized protein n=1 Tax=Microbacterium telephonicum TaxID=1714841 RepID=A0A498BVK8_9MICO|nr:hypothetical protein C7474_2230 [Microbacterium telephonicum]
MAKLTPRSSPRRAHRAELERKFRDEITADFRAGTIGIENGWLVEYHEPCTRPCTEYGCPPGCGVTPIADLWVGVR